jgi:hypothetical protein
VTKHSALEALGDLEHELYNLLTDDELMLSGVQSDIDNIRLTIEEAEEVDPAFKDYSDPLDEGC